MRACSPPGRLFCYNAQLLAIVVHLLCEGRPLERLAPRVQCWAHDAMLATPVERMLALFGYCSAVTMQIVVTVLWQMRKRARVCAHGASVRADIEAHTACNRCHCYRERNEEWLHGKVSILHVQLLHAQEQDCSCWPRNLARAPLCSTKAKM